MSNCPSCREPLDYPSGDGCAAMNMHKEKPMTDDLVARLRDDSGDWLTDLAADRIEELEKRADTFADGWREERLKMIDAEDKLATAVVALETLCQLVDEQYADRLYTQSVAGWEHFADHVGDIARTTLAELKGDPDA